MSSQHWYHFSKIKSQVTRKGGSRIDLRGDKFPLLENFGLSLLTLESKALREPHWLFNVNDLSYWLEGNRAIKTPAKANNE